MELQWGVCGWGVMLNMGPLPPFVLSGFQKKALVLSWL
jgi:hypothetical protein